MNNIPHLHPARSRPLADYELLDSGDGLKLERFGKYTFARPESQAMWSRALPQSEWNNAHAVFIPSGEESGGHWELKSGWMKNGR
jgi:23S rRNA (cytosine1962-C5)-methyltransferase